MTDVTDSPRFSACFRAMDVSWPMDLKEICAQAPRLHAAHVFV